MTVASRQHQRQKLEPLECQSAGERRGGWSSRASDGCSHLGLSPRSANDPTQYRPFPGSERRREGGWDGPRLCLRFWGESGRVEGRGAPLTSGLSPVRTSGFTESAAGGGPGGAPHRVPRGPILLNRCQSRGDMNTRTPVQAFLPVFLWSRLSFSCWPADVLDIFIYSGR